MNQPAHPKDCDKIPFTLPVSGATVLLAKYRFLTEDLDKISDLAAVPKGKPSKARSLAAEASLVTFNADGSFITMEEILKWPLDDTLALHAAREEEGFFDPVMPAAGAELQSS